MVGLIASRITLRAIGGATRLQQLLLVEIPSAKTQIMVGVNQCLMAALSMVIIAAVIGGFDDIGWEVLLTMRKAQFGQSLLAGLVIVAFAIIIDRMSGHLARERALHDPRVALGMIGAAMLVTVVLPTGPGAGSGDALLQPLADAVDRGLGAYTSSHGAALDGIKEGAMFYGLLPLRIGLDDAVLPFTWGIQWTQNMTLVLFATAAVAAFAVARAGRVTQGLLLVIGAGVVETGIAELPWPFVLIGAGAIGWVAGGLKLALFAILMLASLLVSSLWQEALLWLYLAGAAVLTCAGICGVIGLLCAVYPVAWRVVRPVCDMLQTIPLFVFLIPVLMFFQIGEFSVFLAICRYAVVPMIRYTRHGLVSTPEDMIEAAVACGATERQMMLEIRAPYATPAILSGLNQTIL